MSSADFDPGLKLGTVLTNKELVDLFKCGPQGGMRRSLATNTVVITTSPSALYADRWVDGNLHYTGMGLHGDQRLDRTQNRTLAESQTNGVTVHLFEVLADNQYAYRGPVALAGEPYQERQLDSSGQERLVWMFPLRLLAGAETPPLPAEVLERAQAQRARAARRLSDEEVARRAQLAGARPDKRTVASTAMSPGIGARSSQMRSARSWGVRRRAARRERQRPLDLCRRSFWSTVLSRQDAEGGHWVPGAVPRHS